jgi:hypothetical protein
MKSPLTRPHEDVIPNPDVPQRPEKRIAMPGDHGVCVKGCRHRDSRRGGVMRIVAIVLIVAGVLGQVDGGFSYTRQTHDATLRPLEISVSETQRVNVLVWAGGSAVGCRRGTLARAQDVNWHCLKRYIPSRSSVGRLVKARCNVN